MGKRRRKKKKSGLPRSWALLSLALVPMLAMGGALNGEFLFDDVSLIEQNTSVHSFEDAAKWLSGGLWDTNYLPNQDTNTANFWRPLVLASYAFNWVVGGNDPFLFHLTNLLLHAANAVLLFRVLEGWTGSGSASLIGAAFFALHPALTESVCWISGRPDLLCAMGLLVTVLGVRKGAPGGYSFAALGTLVAFGSKETAVTLPIFVTLELASQKRQNLNSKELKRLAKGVWPALAVSVGFLLVFFLWGGHHGARAYGVDTGNHALLILEAYGRYLELALVPHDVTVGQSPLQYDAGRIVPHSGYVALGALLLGLALASLLALTKSYSPLSWGLLAFVGLLLPVSGVRWLDYEQLIWPRFLYLPLLGLSLLVGALGARTVRPAFEKPRWALIAVVALAFGFQARSRSVHYQSAAEFWRAELTAHPDNFTATEHFIVRELNAQRPGRAYRLSKSWLAEAERLGSHYRSREVLIHGLLDGLLASTPDREKKTLASIAQCSFLWASGKPCTLRLTGGERLRLGEHREQQRLMRKSAPRYLLKAANAASRLGDKKATLRAIDALLRECHQCWTLLSEAAIYAARIDELGRAKSLMQTATESAPQGAIAGAAGHLQQINALGRAYAQSGHPSQAASYYIATGAYGRAYEFAAPAINSPELPSAAATNLARVALLAGYKDEAQQLLAQHLNSDQSDAALAAIERELPFADRPTPPDLFVPLAP